MTLVRRAIPWSRGRLQRNAVPLIASLAPAGDNVIC